MLLTGYVHRQSGRVRGLLQAEVSAPNPAARSLSLTAAAAS